MPMPIVEVNFKKAAQKTVQRSKRGTLLLILKGTVPKENPVAVFDSDDIPSNASGANKKYIEMALLGGETSPKAIYVYFIANDGSIDDGLTWAETHEVSWVATASAETDGNCEKIKDWVISQKAYGNEVRAVLPNFEADSEYIVNFATEKIITTDGEFTTEQYCPRIAGLICGTEIEHSITYAVLTDALDCSRLTKKEKDDYVDSGKLIAFFDGEKVKIARGINSLKTLGADKTNDLKKIKISEAVTVIKKDVSRLCQDEYIGKFNNTYSDRCLVLSAIQDYFAELEKSKILNVKEITFNLSAIKNEMKKCGIDYQNMSDEDIVSYDFGTKVFIKCTVSMTDAIEDIVINVEF